MVPRIPCETAMHGMMNDNSPFVFQGEESHGYKELTAAAKRVDSVPAAICTVKEVWAEYGLGSDTITLFRKVLAMYHLYTFLQIKHLMSTFICILMMLW